MIWSSKSFLWFGGNVERMVLDYLQIILLLKWKYV